MSNLEFMKLKINPRFEKFSPLKKQDEMELLEKSLKEKGYIGSPILVWRGYIADGHNRYRICEKYNIQFETEELSLGDNAEEIDVMDWMLTHQLSSKNLSPGEKLAMMDEFKEEVRIENEKKKLEADEKFYGNRFTDNKVDCPPIGGDSKNQRSTYTDNQVAKRAGVGVGTVARYNKVMNSNDEELKTKVKTGQVTVNKAYEEVRKQESRTCKICGQEKKIIDFFGNDTICKECSRIQSEKNINAPKTKTSCLSSGEMQSVYKDVLTAKNAKDQINQDYELSWLRDMCNDFTAQVSDRFFNLLAVIEKMDREHINEAYDIFEVFVSDVFEIQEKFNNKKEI